LLNYFLVWIAIALSDFNFFIVYDILKLILFIFLLLLFINKSLKIDKGILVVSCIYILIILLQWISWGGSFIAIFTSTVSVIFIPYMIIKIVGIEFPKYYVNIIYYYSIISIVFWILSNIYPDFHLITKLFASNIGTDPLNGEQFLIYAFEKQRIYGLIRNPGPFHEPGAFGAFLTLAIIFNTIYQNSFLNKKNIIMIITILTTLSTSAYIGLAVFSTFYLFYSNFSSITKLLLSPIILIIFFNLFSNLDFLEQKLKTQFTFQMSAKLTSETDGRFHGARKSLVVLSKYPFTGRGLLSKTKANLNSEEAAGYGFMQFASTVGIPIFLFYIFGMFKSLRNFCELTGYHRMFSLVSFFAILINLSAQKFTASPIFMIIFLCFVIYGNFGHNLNSMKGR